MNSRETLKIVNGHVEIGGYDSIDLAKKYKTPLYVIDIDHMLNIIEVFQSTIKKVYGNGRMLYASKALCCKGLLALISKTEAGLDVVSGGELYTALGAGFNPDRIYLHGNNKTRPEIEMAIENKIHAIVIDSIDEIGFLSPIAKERNAVVQVMVRLNPGISAHTHDYMKTGCSDSKFGIAIENGVALKAIGQIIAEPSLKMIGVHCHIGSQIFEASSYVKTAEVIISFLKAIKDSLNVEFDEVNLGGGFGIFYEGQDEKFSLSTYENTVTSLLNAVNKHFTEFHLKKPMILLEPGRSVIGEAGITLYTVGTIKDIPGVRKYVSVDGGMFDNVRYAVYQSKYHACVANKADEKTTELVTIAGKCCESGDIVIKDVLIQPMVRGDIICVFSTGAYNYSMASNYNRNFIPPMIGIKNKKVEYLIKPQTYDDLVRNDLMPTFD